jgi:hypothetical protein
MDTGIVAAIVAVVAAVCAVGFALYAVRICSKLQKTPSE